MMAQQECNIEKIIDALTKLQEQFQSEDILQEQFQSEDILEDQLKEIPTSKKATVNNNEQPSERRSEETRPSWCDRLIKRVKKIGKEKKEASNHPSDSRSRKDEEEAGLEIRKLQNDIRQMKAAFENLTQFQTTMRKNLERDIPPSKLGAILKKTVSIKPRPDDLKEIRRKVFNLKCEIPSLLYKQSSRGLSVTDSQTAEENGEIVETGSDIYLPSLHISDDFKDSSAFEEILEKFNDLDFTQQLCLLSLAVFPENREIKRTMLMYWWIGEEFICCDHSENSVTRILDEFSDKRLLEPVEDETKLKPASYKMEPHVHSAVIRLAETMGIFKLYSSEGKLTMEKSSQDKVCLVKGSSLEPAAKKSVMQPKSLQTIFNSSERYPDFTFKWFPLMDSLRVLYLGRWEQTATRHIEVESTKFLKDIKYLKNLRLASFQGISRIEQLEKYICKLSKLVILDLKACYNLERLPEDIGLLESLIYLDVSECYMLDRMPEGIEDLSKLQVLKGFVISQSDEENNCAVKKLVNLRKLSITVNKKNFTVENLMVSLSGLKQLESLKIAWGARFPIDDEKIETTNEESQGATATEKKHKELKEQEDDQEQKKGQTSEEKKGDVEETGKREDGPSSKKEDGRNEEANLEEGKKHEEVKSEKVVDGEKKISPSQEATETIQNKTNDHKGKNKVEEEGDGDKGKADLEERKKQDEVEAEKSKSDKVVEGEKKASPPRESSDIQKKPDDISKVEKEGDGDKEKADLDEGKRQDEVEAERSKSDEVVKGDEKTSPPQESKDTIERKPDDKSKVENEGDGDKEKAGLDEGKKRDEVEAERSKSDKVAKGDEKTSPPQESKDTIERKPDDKSKVEKKGDGDKEKADLDEGKKRDEVEAERSKSDKVAKGDEKTSPPQESKDKIQSKPDNKSKVENEGDGDKEKAGLDEGKKRDEVEAERSKSDKVAKGDEKTSPPQESKDKIQSKPDHKSKVEKEGDGAKGKTDPGEGKKHDKVETESSKSDNGVEGVKKVNTSRELTDAIQNKPDDHQRGEKQEEKGNGEKEKANLDEGKKTDEVKAESSKPDKVIEGDEKTSPPKDSIDTTQNKPDDHREISKVQEKGDGGKNGEDLKKLDEVETKTQKPDKTTKFRKKVSFSENTEALIQKKPDDLKRDKAMEGESHETPSPAKPPKESGLSTGKLKRTFTQFVGNETKKFLGRQENSAIDTSKLPSSLRKLELECFPQKDPPSWLKTENLDNLEKLSIKGGKLSRITDEPQTAEKKCRVQILRLKYLHEFEVEWRVLQDLFPKMKLLEKYECPKIAFCPTDGNGVWRSPNM